MNGDGSAGTTMLGLPGLLLLAVSEVDGELEQAVQTSVSTAWCSTCGVAAKPHGRRAVRVRDLPCAGRPVTLLWLKRLWRCGEPACPVWRWSETCQHVRPRASLTERARREACRLVGEDGLDVAAVAAALGVGWGTVMGAVREHGVPFIDDPRRLAGPSCGSRAPGRSRSHGTDQCVGNVSTVSAAAARSAPRLPAERRVP